MADGLCKMIYNGVDTSEAPYRFMVESWDRPMRGSSRVNFSSRGLQHGVVATGGALNPQQFTVRGAFLPAVDESLTDCIDAMNALLDHWTPRSLSISARPERMAEVLVVDEVQLESGIECEGLAIASIPFTIPAGCWLGSELHEITGLLITADQIPDGSLPALPIYYLSGSCSGGLYLGNAATGEIMHWGKDGLSGTLKIDCERQLCYRGSTPDMEGKYGSYPSLLPRQDNQLTVSGFSGTVTVTWRDRYHFGGALS